MIKKILKYFIYTLSFIILFSLLICFTVWSIIPVYKFPEAVSFTGDKFYNPYKDYDNTHYYRANFHGHSRLGGGLTNGRANSEEDVFKAYRDLEYGFATVSNYHHITSKPPYYDFPYVPAQEYGINIFKTHLLLIGTKRKEYFDQPLWQGADTIQYRINRVKPYNEIVTLAHPAFVNGIEVDYMAQITGYDLMEVVNTFANSVSHWDKALSSGRPAFLLASDDTHNVFRNTDIGRNITMIPLNPDTEADKLYDTLKSGAAYAVTVPHIIAILDRSEKLKVLNTHPQLLSMQVADNTLNIKLNRMVDKIVFSADNGQVMAEYDNVSESSYNIADNNSYVRATVYFDNGSTAYFNPVIRTNNGGGLKPDMPQVLVNYPLSIIKWIFTAVVFLSILYFIARKLKK
ncbi:conserved hypothetical protein [Mucispirillum schaedleri ASF457]|jgi:hypothetical protein|uniref:Uncharacterized protein n=1 Tax=Mucispirillum schaedleri ASF457 TaxID=1379858 RepID=V2QI57_9BACT|nr:hypothetical protein [Mucispirillum schaedleri]MCX4359654.1 hypothetical protein [Mucispirillum schaedleri]USF24049.1 hypothetical protein N508_001124 [Mucispirillum schaedleri ASF457]SIW06308.1 conserved hypothetical protein [Mucispirillum schaedleri ASF457]